MTRSSTLQIIGLLAVVSGISITSAFTTSHGVSTSRLAFTSQHVLKKRRILSATTGLHMSVAGATPDEWDHHDHHEHDPSQKSRRTGSGEDRTPSSDRSPGGDISSTSSSSSSFADLEAGGASSLPPVDIPSAQKFGGAKSRSSGDSLRRRETAVSSSSSSPTQSKFVQGDRLHALRRDVARMTNALIEAREYGDDERASKLERAIWKARQSDAEFVYALATERMEEAEKKGQVDVVRKYEQMAKEARSSLPQFNIEGLWVGKYGDHGYEMINITYVGDTLIAYKVTGDKNVPKGEITFTADLRPNSADSDGLEPIELTDVASKQWGTKFLPRFPGRGQVAAEGFINNQWLDGQLILVGEYFSFAWVPIGHQIFFGRPSAELTIRMLKESKKAEMGALSEHMGESAEVEQMRVRAMKCWEETELIEDELEVEDAEESLVFSRDHDNYYNQEGCFE